MNLLKTATALSLCFLFSVPVIAMEGPQPPKTPTGVAGKEDKLSFLNASLVNAVFAGKAARLIFG